MSTYSERLKDPRWQKKRLEIMERDEWFCRFCGDNESPLAVHHLTYTPGLDPWEYDDNLLITLCENCHQAEHNNRKIAEEKLLYVLRSEQFSYWDVDQLADIICAINVGLPPEVYLPILKFAADPERFESITTQYFDALKKKARRSILGE